MEYLIRPMKQDEYGLLEDFYTTLYSSRIGIKIPYPDRLYMNRSYGVRLKNSGRIKMISALLQKRMKK